VVDKQSDTNSHVVSNLCRERLQKNYIAKVFFAISYWSGVDAALSRTEDVMTVSDPVQTAHAEQGLTSDRETRLPPVVALVAIVALSAFCWSAIVGVAIELLHTVF
jgi:hypothetical protein